MTTRARAACVLAAAALVAGGCGAAMDGGAGAPAAPAGTSATGAPPVTSAPVAATAAAASASAASVATPDARVRRSGRVALGEPASEAIDLEVLPVAGGRSALLVAARGDERAAFVRRVDAGGRMGPVIALADERPAAAFEGDAGRLVLVTSTGEALCVATYEPDAAAPTARGCAPARPQGIVPVGGRLALLEVVAVDPPRPAAAPPKAKASATPPKATPSKKRKERRAAGPDRRGDRPSAAKKKAAAKGGGGSPKVKVEVRLRWATPEGAFAEQAAPTGLAFQRPLDGMTLVDAAPRAGGVDLLWYEAQPRPARAAGLGAADLVFGRLRADGGFDASTRAAVAGGPIEFGWIRDHDAPRLLSGEAGAAVMTLAEKDRACAVVRVAPSRARIAPDRAVCAIDPLRLAAPAAPTAPEVAALGRLLAREPRRVAGQPRLDVGLAAWAGDRAWFLEAGALRSAGRDGEVREEAPPFVARRRRIAWGAFAPDGEGLALAGDRLYRLGAAGEIADLGAAPKVPGEGPAAPPLVEPASSGRPAIARVGATWFVARGEVVRLGPEPSRVAGLRARAHPDTSALVGGPRRGLFVALAGGGLSIDAVDEAGRASPLRAGRVASPVRPGFSAVPRARGGAIVAGVSAADPAKVVAFAIDEDGHVAAPHATGLAVRPGELAVRLVALPGGGAVLADGDRRHVAWLDDDGRQVGAAAWPAGSAAAACLDGEPARAVVPGPEPGRLVRLSSFAEAGTCVVGDVAWAPDGSVRWFGSDARGLDAVAEAAVVRLGPPPPPAAIAPRGVVDAPLAAPARVACPPEMVSIAGRYCVDRFEATLVDATTGRALSPDWPTAPALVDRVLEAWITQRERVGDLHARALPLPFLPPWQRTSAAPVATSRLGARPSAYVTGLVAEAACAAAGKRLCTHDEFVTACRGEADTQFPYGDEFVDGACNVFREEHPAALLHGNPSVGHLDPRLGRVRTSKGDALLRATGATPACRSVWGGDAVHDLVGNLDEWVDEPGGAFAGGFYARSTRSGCDAIVTNHPKPYLDYSTGVRCCRDAAK